MKLKTYLALPILLLTILSMGQTTLGVKGGVGLSNHTEINPYSKSRFSYQIGGVIKHDLENIFGRTYLNYLQVELAYVAGGEKADDVKRFVNYLSLPIMYQRYFSDSDSDVYLEIGPQFMYAVSSNLEEYNFNYGNNDRPDLRSDNQKLKDFSIALNAGIGYSFNRQVDLNLRYTYGITDSFDHVYKDNISNKVSILALSFTYFFNRY